MAVLTEAIEAEGEAEAVTVIGDAIAVTVTVAIITVAAAVLVRALDPHMMIDTIVRPVARVEALEMMTGAIAADEALRQGVVVNHLNPQRMSVIDVPSLCNSLLHG